MVSFAPGVYRGKEIHLLEENGRFKYKVAQTSFIEAMESGKLPKGRTKLDEKLSPDEWKEFRSVSGSLQWLASQTRPELGPVVSLSNRGQETTYVDLKRLYDITDYVGQTSRNGLVYQDIPLDRASTIVTYADGLTKLDSALLIKLAEWLQSPVVQLREGSKMFEPKRKQYQCEDSHSER